MDSRIFDRIVDRVLGRSRDRARGHSPLGPGGLGAHYASIVRHSRNAIIGADLDGTIVSANPAAERLYGYPLAELVGAPVTLLCLPERVAEPEMLRVRIKHGERIDDFETVRVRRDGTRVQASLTVSPIHDSRGRLSGYSSIARDIGRRKEAEHWLAAQHAVTRALADPDALEGPLTPVLAALGENLGWVFGSLWRIDATAGALSCDAVWTCDAEGTREFEELTRAASFRPGDGTPGRVWLQAAPVWVEEFADQEGCLRAQAAARGELRCAVAFPVSSGGEVLGVIEFLSRDRTPPSDGLSELMGTVSAQIGQLIERRRAQSEHARNLVAVNQTRELARSADPGAARAAVCEVARRISDAYLSVFFEPDPDGLGLVATQAAGASLPDVLLPYGTDSGVLRAFESHRPLFVPDPSDHTGAFQEQSEALGAASFLLQPVTSDGESVGVLGVYWQSRVDTLDSRLGSLMDLLAAEASVAMERADMLSRLERVARTDELTGLPNRRAWDGELMHALAVARREGTSVCVAVLDLDHFKAFNDERGHQAGDRLLKQAAAAWGERLRAPDLVARYGGEEFTVLLPGCEGEEAALAAIERLRSATPTGQTCSAGIALWDGPETADALIARADAGLYAAKALGRDRALAHSPAPAVSLEVARARGKT